MKNWSAEIEEDDGVDDAGTIRYDGMNTEAGRSVYPIVNIKIDRQQFSIFEIKRRYDRGAICLDPDFQRNYVWKTKQKSELIESVLSGRDNAGDSCDRRWKAETYDLFRLYG